MGGKSMKPLLSIATTALLFLPSLAATQKTRGDTRTRQRPPPHHRRHGRRRQARQRLPRHRTLSAESLAALTTHYSHKNLTGIGVYESTVFTYAPDVRRAVRAAAWGFARE
jgi:hypothetical protein